MKITLAKTAGFCFGVNRAVQTVYRLVEEGKKVCTLGPIIHNPQIVEELEDRGVRTVDSPDEAQADEVLVIRSHGVGKAVYDLINEKGIETVDATCPFVSKIQKTVADKSGDGNVVIIAGDRNHQEVIGIKGHSSGETYVVSGTDELDNLLREKENFVGKSVIFVSHNTFNEKIWDE